MKKLATLSLITFLAISYTGCSSKKSFEPEKTVDISVSTSDLKSDIKYINRDGATLENGNVISKSGISEISLNDGFVFLNSTNKNEIISTNFKDKIFVGENEITLNNVVVAASKNDDVLAIIYSDNSFELRNNKNEVIFKDYEKVSLANDTRITNPFFLGNLVLFPSLDGKIVIVSLESKSTIKKIPIDPDGQFNNVIFLDVMDDGETLIAATANKLISISTKNIISKDFEIKDVVVDGENIFVATLDGKLIKLSKSLEELSSQKFKFAKINAIASSKNDIYAVESQGYLIKLSKDFQQTTIDDLSYDEKDKIISIRNKFYIGDKVITLP